MAVSMTEVLMTLLYSFFAGPQIRTTKAPSNLEIGSQIGFTCFSDVDFSYLEWYRGNTLLAKSYENDSSIIHYLVSTDDEGLQYKCSTIIKDGSLDKSITLSVTSMLYFMINCHSIILFHSELERSGEMSLFQG